MRRFWIFPLVMGLSVWIFPIVSLLESLIALIGTSYMLDFHFSSTGPHDYSADIVYPAVGAGIGFALAVYDVWRNGFNSPKDQSLARRLLKNIAWCWLYAGLLNGVNAIAFRVFFTLAKPPQDIYWLPLLPVGCAAVLNFVATLWAAFRSVNTDNILSPRVLKARFKPVA